MYVNTDLAAMHNRKYLELPIYIQKHLIVVLFLGKENRCLHPVQHNSVVYLHIHQPLYGWLAELPIFQITGIANTTRVHLGVEGGDGGGVTKWQEICHN